MKQLKGKNEILQNLIVIFWFVLKMYLLLESSDIKIRSFLKSYL